MSAQAALWTGAGAALALAVAGGLADRARNRRRNLDAPGWVPWTAIQVAATFAAVLLTALAVAGR